ncbi:MAG TPA: hypothetical protein VGG16_24940 [Streptosporangiaceae bacterium]|jgi:hypothetical protein
MKSSESFNLLIGVLILGWILYRQLQAQPAKADLRLPVILAVLGIVDLSSFLGQHGHHPGYVFAALAGSFILAVVFAAVRASTMHIWVNNGQAWRKGNLLTAVLWIVSLGVHLGYDYLVDGRGALAGLGAASLTMYFAITLTVQRLMVQARARRIADKHTIDPETPISVRWP